MEKEELIKHIKNISTSILLLAVLVLGSMYFDGKRILNEGNTDVEENLSKTYKELSPEVFNSMLRIKDTNNFFLLNVGSSSGDNIAKTDAFIPYTNIIEEKNKLPKNPATRIVVYSKDGKMSQIAAKKLILLGYLDVFELKGGINSLNQRENFPKN
jgi:rhodanese-related sulfurtransferase